MMIHQFWSGPGRPSPMIGAHQWDEASVPAAWLEFADETARSVLPSDLPRHRANVVRLLLLSAYGGMWADYDLTVIGDLDTLPVPATASHQPGLRCNCWMSFPQSHPALEQALDAIAEQKTSPIPHRLKRAPFVSGEVFLSSLWGPEIAEVPLHIDAGTVNPDAPKVLAHRGTISRLGSVS